MDEFFVCLVCEMMYLGFGIFLFVEFLFVLEINIMMMINEYEYFLVYILFKIMWIFLCFKFDGIVGNSKNI